MLRELIDGIPLWGVLALTITIVWLASEAGYRSGRRHANKTGFDNDTQISSMTGAHLGLLAFILAFTFSMAAGHFDTRKKVILEEANAIQTAYLRTELIEGEPVIRIRELIRQYSGLRACSGATCDSAIIPKSEELHDEMWHQMSVLANDADLTVMHSLLANSLNEIFDLHEQRVAAGIRNRIPPSIWVALYVVLSLSMLGMGFQSGLKGSRGAVPSAALALSFSMVLYLIADLDRPDSGMVQPDGSALMALEKRLGK